MHQFLNIYYILE